MTRVDCRFIALDHVSPDPTQPRKSFAPDEIGELAASIREHGQLQPALVRPDPQQGDGFYLLIAGERRYRALLQLDAREIVAVVTGLNDAGDILDAQIIENVQRQSMSAMEEARAYQRRLDQLGGDVVLLAGRLGLKQAWRITERTCLLNLLPEYQQLFDGGQLSNIEAFHLAQLDPEGQRQLFRGIRRGLYPNRKALRAAQQALSEAATQTEMFAAAKPSPADLAALSLLERRIDQACAVLAAGFDDNQIMAARRVDKGKAIAYADKLALIRTHLSQMETALRASATVNELFDRRVA